jgi:hypothetical protein
LGAERKNKINIYEDRGSRIRMIVLGGNSFWSYGFECDEMGCLRFAWGGGVG